MDHAEYTRLLKIARANQKILQGIASTTRGIDGNR